MPEYCTVMCNIRVMTMTESHHIDTEIAEKTNSRKTTCFWRLGIIIFICLLLLGAIVRIYGAWELRHNLDPDSGVVALMAKHMAEGTDFPVFFTVRPTWAVLSH